MEDDDSIPRPRRDATHQHGRKMDLQQKQEEELSHNVNERLLDKSGLTCAYSTPGSCRQRPSSHPLPSSFFCGPPPGTERKIGGRAGNWSIKTVLTSRRGEAATARKAGSLGLLLRPSCHVEQNATSKRKEQHIIIPSYQGEYGKNSTYPCRSGAKLF